MIKIEIKNGEDITPYFKKRWNKTIYKVFKSEPVEDLSRDIFFIVKNGTKIVSVGALTPVKIKFKGEYYNILGISEVASLVQGKGYGKILMKAIINYVNKSGKTSFGFTGNKTSPFYEKSGLKVKKNMLKKFVYQPKNEKEKQEVERALKRDGNVIYIEGKDKLISKVSSSKSKAQLPCMYW